MSQYEFIDKRVPIALDNPSIYHDISKCKNCTLCRRACADVMSVLDYYDLDANGDVPVCIHCGQGVLPHLTFSIRYSESLYYVEMLHFCAKL